MPTLKILQIPINFTKQDNLSQAKSAEVLVFISCGLMLRLNQDFSLRLVYKKKTFLKLSSLTQAKERDSLFTREILVKAVSVKH